MTANQPADPLPQNSFNLPAPILIVDDDQDFRFLVRELLSSSISNAQVIELSSA